MNSLVVPVLRDCDTRTLHEINEDYERLTDRARAKTLKPMDVFDGTFTLSNLGALGVDHFTPIVNPPQVAILGLGRVRKDQSLYLSLTIDHRVVDGAPGARFLSDLADVIETRQSLDWWLDRPG